MRRMWWLVLLVFMLPGFAWAHSCPSYVQLIDDSLEQSEQMGLSDEAVEEIKSLRDEGERLHEEGKHEESIAKLDEALALLESGG